jgi:putative peptidoglycan lipid II flippase
MLRSSVVVTIIGIVSYLVSFVSQLLIATLFGASVQLDAYLVAISVPFLFMTATGGVLTYSMVPILVQKRIDQAQYRQFSSLFFVLVILLAILLPSIAFVLTPTVVKLLVPAYSDALKAEVILMSRVMWCVCGSALVGSYLTSMNNAAKRFFVPTLVVVLPYLGMIGFSFMWGRQRGPLMLIWGMLAGSLVAIPLLFFGVRREFILNPSVLSWSLWQELAVVVRRMPIVLFSMFGLAIYGTIDAIWVSRLGANSFSYLAYGQRLLLAMGNIVLLGPMTVLLPYLSEAVARGRLQEFRAQTLRAVRMLLFYFSGVCVIVSVLTVPMVKLLFERGAFDRTTTLRVSSIMPGLSIGVTAMITVVLLLRAFYAKGDITGAVMITTAAAVVYFILSGLLSQMLGLQGIVAAYFLAWGVALVCAVGRLWKGALGEIFGIANLKFLWQLALALGVCSVLTFVSEVFLVKSSLDAGILNLGLRLLVATGIGSAGFLIVSAGVFRMQEITLLLGLVPGMKPNSQVEV